MSESMRSTIAELQRHLEGLDQQAIDTKKTINSLCRVMNEPPLYTEVELSSSVAQPSSQQLNGDEYFNKPLATVVRMILETRRDLGQGPAEAEEIFIAMQKGGFEFDGRSDDKALHGLKISLSKNTTTFIKLPNGKFSLAEWYAASKVGRGKTNGNGREINQKSEQEELLKNFEELEALQDEELEAPSKPR